MTGLDTFRGAILLQRGDQDLIAAASGTTGAAPDAGCTLSTRFQIASVSKQFTAAAILLLADRGLLSVDDPVHRWLDGCPASWQSMTIGHLLSHTAGLVHWLNLPGLDLTRPMAADEELRFFAAAPLLSAPGQRFSYSSPGYVLLAWIAQRAADQAYASFLAREIFEPLAMAASFAGNGDGEPGLASGHRAGTRVASSLELDTVGTGAGDVWSTVGDLARWDRALASGRILAESSRRAMLTVQAPIGAPDTLISTEGYGYGWFIGRDSCGRRVIYHTGDNVGFVAVNIWYPDDDVRLAVLSNEETTDLIAIIRQAMAAAFPGSGEMLAG